MFRTANLFPRIRLKESDSTPTECLQEGLETIHCRGNISVQDFKPRNFSFSFGFCCDRNTSDSSLKGLTYKISIHEQSNETNCVYLPHKVRQLYSQYHYGLLPDLIGVQDMLTVLRHENKLRTYLPIFERLCYQNTVELMCHVIIPECDPASSQVIHPCKEMCHDFRKTCSQIAVPKSIVSEVLPDITFEDETVIWDTSTDYNCDYLPALNGDIPCLYRSVSCKSPPVVKNATLLSTKSAKNITYSVFDTAEYSCIEGFVMQGNKSVSCMYNGQWSTPPKCLLKNITKSKFLNVSLPLFLILLTIILLIAGLKYRNFIKMKQVAETLTRNKQYDAFVSYCYQGQDLEFSEKIIPQELEDEHGFTLCIHRRDFKAGWDIKWNIMNAIRNSNSAIIIMSQDYINSLWCVEEFEDCYMENTKDPEFKLFVILMQPVDTLNITNEYMKSFFAKKTYLERDDPKLFKKIAEYLFQMKHAKGRTRLIDKANNPLIGRNNNENEADGIIFRDDKENIKLRRLNNQMKENMKSMKESGKEASDQPLVERDMKPTPKNQENFETMETRVEVHNGDISEGNFSD